MLTPERISIYLRSLETDEEGVLADIEQEALDQRVPIIKKETQSFLKVMLAVTNPGQILEIGTAVGFSAILMCQHTESTTEITTIENYEKRIPIAQENFHRAGVSGRVKLLAGDAAKVLKTLRPGYDFVFLDAAKGQYSHYLPEILRILTPGGVLITDNVLQEGETCESRYAVKRRDRTIHTRIREFLYEIKHDENLITSILPVGDGVALSVKKGK